MATPDPDDPNEMFSGVYERLKEHESALIELLIDEGAEGSIDPRPTCSV